MPSRPPQHRTVKPREPRSFAKAAPQERLSGRALQARNYRIKVRDSWQCRNAQCGLITDDGQVDHIIAVARGGRDSDDNLQYLCDACHAIKSKIESHGLSLPNPRAFPLTYPAAKAQAQGKSGANENGSYYHISAIDLLGSG